MDWKNYEVKFPEAPDVGETVRYRRYQAIEKQYPNAFIIDRMGDFYEILGDRAVEAANAIGLTLTSRSMGTEGRVPMVGFPYHVAPQYIDKLVQFRAVVLAPDGEEKQFFPAANKAAQERSSVVISISDAASEPNPFDDPVSFSPEETENQGQPTEKHEPGIQERRRRKKPQLSLFDLTEAEEKSEKEQLIERVLQRGTAFEDGKFRIYDEYRKNPTSKAFADYLKSEYGSGGQSIDDTFFITESRGIKILVPGVFGRDDKIFLSWKEVANRIGDLIDEEKYLSEEEIKEYREKQEAKRKAEEEKSKRLSSLIERVINGAIEVRKQRIMAAYSGDKESADFAAAVCDEYGYSIETGDGYFAQYITSQGVRLHELDENGKIVFEANLTWRAFASLIGDMIDRGAYALQGHKEERQGTNNYAEIVEQMVALGTRNTESGKYAYYYGTFGKDEEYVRAHCNEIKEAMLARGEIKAVESDEWYIHAEFYEEFCEKLNGVEQQVKRIVESIVSEGTQATLDTVWLVEYADLGEDEAFVREHIDLVREELLNREEVADVEIDERGIDTTFFYAFCPNYELQEGDEGYEEQVEQQDGENLSTTATEEEASGNGPKARYRNNIAAIRLVNFLDSHNMTATEEQRATLSRYVGWGGLPQAFDAHNAAWAKEYEELKGLLSAEDYEQAKASTLSAFYTPQEVIAGMYDILQRFGVQGGNRILEPAMGTGNFFAYMPASIAEGAQRYGVELDRVTGRIAAKLYPDINVQIKGFEDTSFPDGMFDVVVGNVPFGGFGVFDSAYNRYNFRIHDYFLAKSIDKVRAGGIVAVITSKGTMDKQNESARRYVAERAELLGAIRLPNNAFKSTAGTEAVADILFFRKREEKLQDLSGERWIGLAENADGMRLNAYFVEHPEMVLGTLAFETGLYGGMDINVKPDGRELGAAIAEAAQNLPREIFTARERTEELSEAEKIETDYNIKEGCFTVIRGKVYQRIGDAMEERTPSKPKDAVERITAMIALKDELHHILDLQAQGCSDEVLAAMQVSLNARYDAFVKAYGALNTQTNVRLFRDDAESAFLFASENVEGESYTKADIFSKRTVRPYIVPTETKDCYEAMQISKNERGRVDIAYIEELTGKDYDTVLTELESAVFRDPAKITEGDKYSGFVTASEYLAGDVVTKLAAASEKALEDPSFKRNVEALQAVQPERISASDIAVRLGAPWIDKKYYEQFFCELVEVPFYLRDGVELFYNAFDSSWRLDQWGSVKGKTNYRQKNVYGTERAPAARLFEDSLNLRATTIYDTIKEDGHERRVLNQAETLAARDKQNQIKEAFADWIFADPERREDLETTYNLRFNRLRLPSYDGSYLRFPGKNPEIELRPHQRSAVERIVSSDGSVLLHHVVGSGKTFTAISAIMKMRQLGICQKAMVAVPNHLVEQWAGDWRRLYPAAKVLVATKEDLEKDNRKRFVSKVALGDWDGILIAQSSFAKIPISPGRQIRKMREEIGNIEACIEQTWEEKGQPDGAVKNLQRIKKNKEKQLKELMSAEKKDNVLLFEELGIDYLFVDEAHYYKNLFLFTKMNNVSGISSAASQRATDLKLKCEYLQEVHGSDRGVVFLTGTPVSNSMTEMYTMQTYLQPTTLKELGMPFFDNWAANFGETVTSMELAPSGQGYRAKTRFAKFTNLPELMTLYRSFADVQTADMVKLDVPTAEHIVVNLTPSETVIAFAEEIAARAERINSGGVDPHIDNMLRITSDGKKLALDPRLYAENGQDEAGNKLSECAKRVFEIWADTADIQGTQIIFCDLSTPKKKFEDYVPGTDFDAYNELKYKLVQRGIPKDEIAYIHDPKNEKEKQALFDELNEGTVRVIIGSTEKCGAGANLQKKLVALHHLDTPYRPADMEQREGRIVRQGNENEDVKILTYVTQRTFDSYSYQILENKQRFISQITRGDLYVREAADIDETTLSYAEIKAITAANPKIKRKMEVDAEVSRLRLLEGRYKKRLFELQDEIRKGYPERIQRQELLVERAQKDLETLKAHPREDDQFEIIVKGKRYTARKEGGQALTEAIFTPIPDVSIAIYRGFQIAAKPLNVLKLERECVIKGAGEYITDLADSPSGNIVRLDNFFADFPDRVRRLEMRLEQMQNDFEIAKEEAKKPFEHTERLKELLSEQAQLNAELDLNRHEEVIVDDETGEAVEAVEKDKSVETTKEENDTLDEPVGTESSTGTTIPQEIEDAIENEVQEEMPVTKERDILLPDRVQLEEFTRKVLKFADDDLLIHNETARLFVRMDALTVYGYKDSQEQMVSMNDFDNPDGVYAVKQNEWEAFISSDDGKDYMAARLYILRAVQSFLEDAGEANYSDEILEDMLANCEWQIEQLKRHGAQELSGVEAYLYADALRILDEQTNYLYADLPTGQDVWTKDRLRLELVRELPAGALKNSLRRYAEREGLVEYVQLGLNELRWLNGRTRDFSRDDVEDLLGDLKFHFERSAFDESKGNADYDDWYDNYFCDDVLRPVLEERMNEEAKREEREAFSDENPLGLPDPYASLKVLALQNDTPLNSGRSMTGVMLLENAEYDGDLDGEWYVVTASPKISENIVLHIGDQIDIETLYPNLDAIDASNFRAFNDHNAAQEYFENRAKAQRGESTEQSNDAVEAESASAQTTVNRPHDPFTQLTEEETSAFEAYKGRDWEYEPEMSLWGEVQHCYTIAPGIYVVSTAGHGGVMIDRQLAAYILSSAARKEAEDFGQYLCFEEDVAACIAFREMIDKGILTKENPFFDAYSADADAIPELTGRTRYQDLTEEQKERFFEKWRALLDAPIEEYCKEYQAAYLKAQEDHEKPKTKQVPTKKEEETMPKTNEQAVSYRDVPIYLQTGDYAREHDEREMLRVSRRADEACRDAIDNGIREHYDGSHLDSSFLPQIIEDFGAERVEYILATTLREHTYDQRYSRENQEWAAGIEISESEQTRLNCLLTSHPVVINGIVDNVRKNAKAAAEETEETTEKEMPAAQINYEEEVIKSVDAEFEAYKASVLSMPAEDIFQENYKIHVLTELKETIKDGVLNDYIDKDYYRALYEERGAILAGLYYDFIGDDYASVNSYGDTADFIRSYCERHHEAILEAAEEQVQKEQQEQEQQPLPTGPIDLIVVDTETTGLDASIDELLQVSIVDGDGNTLYNGYFKPEHTESWPKAEEVNHISPEMVANAPSIQSEIAAIGNILSRAKTIVGYNTGYDLRFLRAAGWQRPEEQKIVDVMQDFAPIYGEWSEERGDYKWQKLSTCAAWYGYEWTERGAHNSLEDCLATLHCYKEMEKEKVETPAYLNGYHESIYGLIYNWKGLKEENYVYTRSQLHKLDENFDAKADRYDGAIAANKTYMVIRLEGGSEEETEQIIRDFLTGKYNEEDLGSEAEPVEGWYWETVTEDFFTGEKNQTAEALIHLFGLREDQLRMQEQQEQEQPKYEKTTARGYPVLKIEKDGSDRNIAIVHRQTDTLDDYIVAIGYDVEDGRWAQGRYDFPSAEAAQEYIDETYGQKQTETDTGKRERKEPIAADTAQTEKAEETTKEKKKITIELVGVHKLGEYPKSILFRMPDDSEFAGYSFYLPKGAVKEEDGKIYATLWPEFTAKLQNREKQTKDLPVTDFAAVFAPKTAAEDTSKTSAYEYITLPREALMKSYDTVTMIKMPITGEYANSIFYFPNKLIKPGKDDRTVRLSVPQDFVVKLQKREEKSTLTREQFVAAMQDVTADDFHKRYERPSEAAWKALKQNLIDNVPEEMKQQPKWVAVVTVVEDGKEHLGKRLIDCHNGSWAVSSDPNTWTDFETALAYAETHGADTIAFALTGEDNIACIDVDSCVGEDGKYSAKAIETYCKADNTYCERSISGKGLHFFGKTAMKDDLKSFSTDGKLEFYRSGHFISMTGDIETGCKEIKSFDTPEMTAYIRENFERRIEWKGTCQRQAGLSYSSDREVLEKAFASKNGDTIKRLYNGEDLYHDHSRSDMALMSHLAYWTNGDIDQMLQIFATSGLYRPNKAPAYFETTAMKCLQNRMGAQSAPASIQGKIPQKGNYSEK